MIAGCFFSSRGGITIYVTAVVVFGTSTVLNAMEAGDHEQQEFLDRSVFSDALRAMRMVTTLLGVQQLNVTEKVLRDENQWSIVELPSNYNRRVK